MRLGLNLTRFSWPGSPENLGPVLGRIARTAEEVGFDSFWVMDHFFQTPLNRGPEGACPEAYATLGFVAGQTSRIRLGTLVTGVVNRHPGVLVKTVSTLDALSGGRMYFGIGAAWFEEEQRGLGIPVVPKAERFERLEEAVRIAKHMWAGSTEPYEGRHYRLERPLNEPNTPQRPHPPILIGGQGPKKTFGLVARYADACNVYELPDPDMIRDKLAKLPPQHPMRRNAHIKPTEVIRGQFAVLRERCEEAGRPYGEIEKTTLGTGALTKDGADGSYTVKGAIERFHQLAELGVDHAIVEPPNPAEEGALDLWAEVAPEVAKIVPAGR
ncbi:LLM class F420-dependent oxidoreductase [Streptomyces glomeratus]|uniref:LLM class F420-dependent oxidoreductase n=1 Tax=Streptomyces glomeratus TaxID=284452 RepID=A0ABP6L1H4_9ACTN|nr:LLM class F420-dependent oxidoreductase [Streptomyces glomeratus]MCF1509557.1 LLM class F420-dependent oxidoreductase [Streptomyces glomeratus]